MNPMIDINQLTLCTLKRIFLSRQIYLNMRRYGTIYALLLILFFTACGTLQSVPQEEKNNFQGSFYYIDTNIVKDRNINLMLLNYRVGVDSLMQKIIGTSDMPFSKAQPDCTFGYLVADAMYEAILPKDSLVQACVSNQGGLRIQYLSPGPISLGNIYELMPFDNLLVVVEVPGTIMQQWMDHIAAWGGWPVTNIHFEIKDKKAHNILINNKPLHPNIIYRVVTSDYIANGGDDCSFLKECKTYKYNTLMRDAIIQYISKRTEQNQNIHFTLENRIQYAE